MSIGLGKPPPQYVKAKLKIKMCISGHKYDVQKSASVSDWTSMSDLKAYITMPEICF